MSSYKAGFSSFFLFLQPPEPQLDQSLLVLIKQKPLICSHMKNQERTVLLVPTIQNGLEEPCQSWDHVKIILVFLHVLDQMLLNVKTVFVAVSPCLTGIHLFQFRPGAWTSTQSLTLSWNSQSTSAVFNSNCNLFLVMKANLKGPCSGAGWKTSRTV